MSIIGLLTDFGLRGAHYVSAMKAIISEINSEIKIIDISHTVKPFSIIEASYLLKSTYSYFPKNSVFVVVVDPGVGGERKIVALKSHDEYYFIGPDNGIFLAALESRIKICVVVENEKYFHQPVSKTFHGRDIMSPVAAHICSNVPLEKIGTPMDPKELKNLIIPFDANPKTKMIRCGVQYVDGFGNITTNLKIDDNQIDGTEIFLGKNQRIFIKKDDKKYQGIFVSHFASVQKNTLLIIKGSTGYLEISINQGNASEILQITSGDNITIQVE